jgi:serine/threonine-protein kinase
MVRDQDGMVMLFVPAGEFLMGSSDSDPQAVIDEKPQHMVFLEGYWIDQTEVTNEMYARCVADNACTPPMEVFSSSRENYYGNPEYSDYPVIYVKRINANEYCQWAGVRLPSEAEWEKAARGENGNLYPWGNEFDCTAGNFDDEVKFDKPVVPGGPHCDGFEDDTSPVGTYPSGASPYGALDMAGNVWEWVGSKFMPYPYNKEDGREDLSAKVDHIVRGGAFGSTEDRLRSAARFSFFFPTSYHIGFGFRCADSIN